MTGIEEERPVWYDSHCHLHDEEDVTEKFERARALGVTRMILVGTNADSSKRAVDLAALLRGSAWATVGLHPHEASLGTDTLKWVLTSLRPIPGERLPGRVVAIGECGLDYYYDNSPREPQRQAFAEQIALANSLGLALVVHTRSAWDDTFSILREVGVPERTVIHCFTGGVKEARICLELGASLSFSGIVTFSNATDVHAAAAFCPLDRILVETDSPFLTPVPHRGERNEPAHVALVGNRVAQLRKMAAGPLAEATRENTSRLFDLPR